MRAEKRDIMAFMALLLAMIVCVRYFYVQMSDERSVTAADPYKLVVPMPTALLAIHRPSVFEKMILPMENIRKAFSDHTPAIFLSLIQQNPDVPSLLIAYYPQGDVLYVPMDHHTARRVFKQLDASFTFPAQQREESSVPVSYYPDIDQQFLGCYYHEGIFVASYNRKLLVKTVERQQATSVRILPELADLTRKKGKSSTMNLFLQSAPLDLQVQLNDSVAWKMKDQWLAVDLFDHEGSLCCINEQPYEEALENFYPCLCDTITTRIHRLFPHIKATAQVSHDESVAYFTVRGN